MATREYKFDVGPQTPNSPISTTPTAADDVITKSFADANYGQIQQGTRAAPLNITAGGGISAGSGNRNKVIFVQGSGGAVDITANPQISAGSATPGQLLILIFCSSVNTLKLDDGTGLKLNGSLTGGADDAIILMFDGVSNWIEIARS